MGVPPANRLISAVIPIIIIISNSVLAASAADEIVPDLFHGFNISGSVFEDINANGCQEEDESGLSGRQVLLLLNGIQIENTTTDREGRYSFNWIGQEIYSLVLDPGSGWKITSPESGSHQVDLTDGKPSHLDFGFVPLLEGCQTCGGNAIAVDALSKDKESLSSNVSSENLMPYNGTIMHPSLQDLQRWNSLYRKAPGAFMDPQIMTSLKRAPGASFSLLGRLQYTPSERNQGACGNCWAWAGTGVMEIALNAQRGLKDRISIQYLNSNFCNGSGSDWACCGGWLDDVASFYAGTKKALPWSNTNAGYQDGSRSCSSGGTAVSASSIGITPNYKISSIQAETITTHGINKEQAILNIKNILNQGKAVWFAYFLPTGADWTNFYSFWGSQSESTVWDPSPTCGKDWDSGGGHAVLCVGYDDSDPSNRYWIMLNSWGSTSGRPGGLFRVSMDMNYECYYYYTGYQWYSFFWQTLNMAYSTVTAPAVTNSNGASAVTANSARLNGEVTSTGGEDPTVHIYWGDNDGGTDPKAWDHYENLGMKGAGTFSKDISGLSRGTRYYYMCYASNSGGSAWASSTATFDTFDYPAKLIGADDVGCTHSASGKYFCLSRFKALENGCVNSIRLKATASGNVKVAIYADNSGNPGALLSKADASSAVSPGWNDIRIPSACISKDAYYWLAFNSNANLACCKSNSGTLVYKSAPYDTFKFPDEAGTGFTRSGTMCVLAGWMNGSIGEDNYKKIISSP